MQWLCEQHSVSLRTLKSWKSRYNKGGFPALADKPRDDKGKSRWMEQHPTAKTIVAAAYLESNRSKVAAYEALVRQCHLVGVSPTSSRDTKLFAPGSTRQNCRCQ
jgi:transposase